MITSLFQETDSKIIFPLKSDISYYMPLAYKNETFGNKLSLPYFVNSEESDLIKSAWQAVRNNPNNLITKEAQNLLLLIQEIITSFLQMRFDISNMPPLRGFNVDDGSILIEWIHDKFRIGFSIEPNIEGSSWYLATNMELGEINAAGYISNNVNEKKRLFLWLLNFVLSHT